MWRKILMARILIGSMPLTGHVNPGLPIARKLIERGNEVWWYTGQNYQKKVEATGATFLPMKAGYDFDDTDLDGAFPGRNEKKGLAQLKFDIKSVFVDSVPGYVQDMESIISEIKPDVLLMDNGFAAGTVIFARTGVPWATYGIMPLGVSSRDTAPTGLGLLPDSSPLGRLRNRALRFLFNKVIFRDVNAYANQVLMGLGMPSASTGVFDIMSPFLYMQPTHESFEYARSDLPAQVHFIGPFLPSASPDFVAPAWWAEMVNSQRPVVHVTQGTVATEAEQLLVPTINALANEDVLVVVTTGGKPVETLNMLNLPANVRVESFIPHYHLLPYVDVMVTNGGYGGVQIALANGVPLVVAGATEDKPEVAQRVAWSKTGINLKTGTPTVEQVRSAVKTILADPTYNTNAQALAANMKKLDAPVAASMLVERLAQTQQPVLRGMERKTAEVEITLGA